MCLDFPLHSELTWLYSDGWDFILYAGLIIDKVFDDIPALKFNCKG